MQIKVTDYLTIELTEPNELIELISDDDMVHFMQSLSCNEVVFQHVSDQIIHGCTDDGYHSSICGSTIPSTALDLAVRAVSKSADDLSKKTIEELERKLIDQEAQTKEIRDRYYDLYYKALRQSSI